MLQENISQSLAGRVAYLNLLPLSINEIKSGQTITNDYFKGILFWNKISGTTGGTVVYAGSSAQKRRNKIEVLPFVSPSVFDYETPQ